MNTTKSIKFSSILGGNARLTGSIFAGIIVVFCVMGIAFPQTTCADFANNTDASYVAKTTNEAKAVAKTIKVMITAYSSTADQTDDSPFVTASGKLVGDGIMASNLLPFGTKVKIPKLYGDKVFTVQDRMNKKKGNYHVDIWMPTRNLALNFGAKVAEIQVLED